MRSFASFVLALALCAAAPFGSARADATTKDAEQYVSSLGDKALAVITNKATGKDAKEAQLEKIFSENVDIPWVGRFVMGRFWRDATDDQKKRYLAEYQNFVIKHYASRFTQYSSGSFKITGSKDDGDGEFVINMMMTSGEANAEPVAVDYRVRADKNKFKVFDIIVEGVSMITTQRSEFSSVLNSNGIDYLIDQLAHKSLPADLSGDKKSQ